VRRDREVEQPEAVARKRIRAALQHNHFRVIRSHDFSHDRLEDLLVAVVVDAVLQRYVDRTVPPGALPDFRDISGLWEVVSVILVERDRHDSICVLKGVLNSISMVHVDIYVPASWRRKLD